MVPAIVAKKLAEDVTNPLPLSHAEDGRQQYFANNPTLTLALRRTGKSHAPSATPYTRDSAEPWDIENPRMLPSEIARCVCTPPNCQVGGVFGSSCSNVFPPEMEGGDHIFSPPVLMQHSNPSRTLARCMCAL